MIHVLVVDDDKVIRTTIARHLMTNGYSVEIAETVQGAIEILTRARIDVLLTDLRMSERDGIDLLVTIRKMSPHTRSVLMSAFATARDYQTAVELGAVTVLCKPFTPNDLLAAIRQAEECEGSFHGTFHGMSLIDILQMLHLARRSVSLHVRGAEPGMIHMRDGEIVHAETSGSKGLAAFSAILAVGSGRIRTTALPDDVAQSITRPFESLLLDSLRELDEIRRDDGDRRSNMASTGPTEDATFDERPRVVWSAASQAIGGSTRDVIALALSLKSKATTTLAGGVDPERWSSAAHHVLDATSRVAGGRSFACDLIGVDAVGVVSSDRDGFAIVLFDVLPQPSSATWFRSLVSTVARFVLVHR